MNEQSHVRVLFHSAQINHTDESQRGMTSIRTAVDGGSTTQSGMAADALHNETREDPLRLQLKPELKPELKPFADMSTDEQETLRGQHRVIKACMNGQLVLAPVADLARRQGLRILDSGAGDGYWLEDLASSLAESAPHTFVATDITTVRFPTGTAATAAAAAAADVKKFEYYQQSITEPWPPTFDSSFDLVHQRFTLAGCRDFPIKTAVLNLCKLVRPGGWIQLVEPDQKAGENDGPVYTRFMEIINEILQKTGIPNGYASCVRRIIEDLGFKDTHETCLVMQLGAANPDQNLGSEGANSTAIAAHHLDLLVRNLPDHMRPNACQTEMHAIASTVAQELAETGGCYPFRVVWARRPADWIGEAWY